MYKKITSIIVMIIGIILVVIFSPLIILSFIFWLIFIFIPSPLERYIYKKSNYYKDFNEKYNFGITYDFKYKLYNKLSNSNKVVNYIKYNNNTHYGIEYCNNLFIFMDYDQIYFDKEKYKWIVSEEIENLDEEDHEHTSIYTIESLLDDKVREFLNENNIDNNKKYKLVFNKYTLESYLYKKEKEEFIIYKNVNNLIKKMNKFIEINKE